MSALTHRYDFVLFFDVQNGNPNGDPDAGNMPRIDPETGHGIVTDVCLKRKVRNYVELAKEGATGFRIYVQEKAVLNERNAEAYTALNLKPEAKKLPKKEEDARAVTRWMCDNFYDIRTFGAVMSTEVNCGQVRGPVQFTFARSEEAIVPAEVSITRMAVTNMKDRDNERTMGRKFIVPYGLYRVEGFISAPLAEKTGFSEADVELLWESLINMFEHDHSAARGKMSSRKLFVFKHEKRMGNAPAQTLFDLVQCQRVTEGPARSFADYRLCLLDRCPEGVTVQEKL
ncbi:MAG: type I-C CRISPR-associated protein Cas7/Csd2 [Desulfovibrionaceae bacterium]|nr:MAG: type I-C CRISPR-associated protein Cas7/Csd2 [Desulfovibrionaceae bacterium]